MIGGFATPFEQLPIGTVLPSDFSYTANVIPAGAGLKGQPAFSASRTVTLAAPKLPLVLPPAEGGAGDLVVADESWDLDHYLHENPELKRTAFAWMMGKSVWFVAAFTCFVCRSYA